MKKSAKSLDWDQRGQLWYPGWGTQTCQQFVHPASHLLWGRLALLVFPWAQFWLNQVAGQHQMVMHNGDHVTPALKLLWGPQTRGFPQQRLFVKAIPMLLPEAQSVSQSNLSQIGLWVADPDKPTDAWVTLLVGRMRPHHAQNSDWQPASLFDMHVLPPAHLHWTIVVIGALPHAIWLPMRRRILWLQLGSIFAWSPFLARWGWGHPVEAAIANDPAQHSNAQPTTTTPQPGGIIASVQRDNRVGWDVWDQADQLCVGHLDSGRLRCDSLLIQDVGPATGRIWQDHQRRKLPAKGDRFLAFWQVMQVLCRTIRRSHGIRTRNLTGIDPDPEPFPWIGFGQVASKGFSQALFIDAPILERFIQTRPFALKPHRLREFGKRFGLRLGHQGIDGVEQGISATQVIDILAEPYTSYLKIWHSSISTKTACQGNSSCLFSCSLYILIWTPEKAKQQGKFFKKCKQRKKGLWRSHNSTCQSDSEGSIPECRFIKGISMQSSHLTFMVHCYALFCC